MVEFLGATGISSGTVDLVFRFKSSSSSVALTPTTTDGGTVGTATDGSGDNAGWKLVTVSGVPAASLSSFTLTVSGSQTLHYGASYFVPEGSGKKLIGFPLDETISVTKSCTVNFGTVTVTKAISAEAVGDTALTGRAYAFDISGGALASGIVRSDSITPGASGSGSIGIKLPCSDASYSIAETTSIDGVTPSYTPGQAFSLTNTSPNAAVTITNTPHGSLRITKSVDGGVGAGVQFHVSVLKPDGSTVNITFPEADADPYTATLTGLIYGNYVVTETDVPDGYRFLDINGDTGADRSVSVPVASTTVEAVAAVHNQKYGKITAHKIDNLGDNVSGVRFEYRLRTGTDPETYSDWIETGLTGNDGKVEINNLIPGHYEVREKTAPSGYVMDDAVKTADLDAGEAETLADFVNEGQGNIIVRKEDASGKLLPGASFKVVQPDGDTHYASDTNNDGIVVFTGLTIGKWVVTETAAPSGYYFDPANPPSQTINKLTVSGATLTFTNYPDVGSLKIKKVDAQTGGGMANVEFQLSTAEDFSALVSLADSTTDANGDLQMDNLPSGTYYIRETPGQNASGALLEGYVANDTVKKAVVSYNTVTAVDYQGNPLTFTNIPWQKIEVNKLDTHEQPVLVAGAVFHVFKKVSDGPYEKVAELTTDEHGIATSDVEFEYGSPNTVYYVKEIKAPAGYGISDDGYQAVPYIGPGATADVFFFDYKLGSITVTKAMLGMAGTADYEFTITKVGATDPVDSFKIKPGESHPTPNLEYGDYIIHETIPADANFRLVSFSSQEFGLKEGNDYLVSIGASEGTLTESVVARLTLDVSVICTNQLLGKIQVTKKDSTNLTKYLSGAEFTLASADDPAMEIPALKTGDDGTATTGWLVPGDYTVTETKAPDGYHIDDAAAKTVTVTSGETINKTFTDSLGSVLIHKSSSYGDKPAVQGVQFQLLKSAPAADGSVPAGDIVGTETTGADGNAEFKGLLIGHDYWVREIQQAPGYNIDKTIVYKVTASYKPDSAAATFVNDPVGAVKVTKADKADDKVKLAGAVFGIYSDAGCKTLVETLAATDSNGFASSKELAFGADTVYYVKEITAPSGYILSDEVQQAKFTTPGQVVELQFADVRNAGSLVIKKIDNLTGAALAGAEFKLYTDEAMTAQVGNAVTSGSDGIVRFDNLVPGDYWIYESKAPENYDQLTVPLMFTVVAGDFNPAPKEIQNQYNPPQDIQTGMMDWNVLLIGGIALLAGLLLVVYTRKRRMNTNAR